MLRFDHPPVNALSIADGFLAEFDAALGALADNDAVAAIVVTGSDRLFSAGADINDFTGNPNDLDLLRTCFLRIERLDKPVVAAITGICFGGGVELALSCHYRVCTADARFALPEVTLGLLPGGGGTQRLPRLVGAKTALAMMLGGKPVTAADAAAMGLVDAIAPDKDVVACALRLIDDGRASSPRPIAAMAPPADLAAALADTQTRGHSLAQRQIFACVEGLTTDIEAGLAREALGFAELLQSESSLGLRHAFFGQRLVSRLPTATGVVPNPIRTVTIIGGGLMGTGIAIALVNAGLQIRIVEPRADARAKAAASVPNAIQRDVVKGRISEERAQARIAAFHAVGTLEEAADSDLFIEAVFEDMAVKREVFTHLDRVAPAGAILASNTSTLDLNEIAAFTQRPQDVVGLHFFSPANVMRLLEIVRGDQTSPQTLATAMGFAKAIGKVGVVAGVCDGFIGNRMFEEYLRQAYFLLEDGALPEQVDKALEAWGMAMGPCRVMDLAGQDIGWSIRKRRAIEQPDRPYSAIPDRICELGRFGQKTGAGFYLYPDGRTPQVDPLITDLVIAESTRLGIVRREISDEEIVSRCVLALVNEGARIVGEGIAYRPVDVDMIYVHGYGFPAERGGPMFHADRLGLANVLKRIEAFAGNRQGWAWSPAPLLRDLVAQDRTFEALDT